MIESPLDNNNGQPLHYDLEAWDSLSDVVVELSGMGDLNCVYAFDLATEVEFTDTSSADFKLIFAKTIHKLAILSDNNPGLLERAFNIAIKIKELEYKDFRNQAYCFYILSNVEYLNENKDLALKYIKRGYFISKSHPDIKNHWKKLNREQLKKWRKL